MRLALDASIVIESFLLSVWLPIRTGNEIILPETAFDEISFYRDQYTEDRVVIDKEKEVNPFVTIVTASPEDLAVITRLFNDVFLKRLDPGERELIALSYSGNLPEDCKICFSDIPAIEAIALIDKKEMGISYEELLRSIGSNRDLSSSAGAYTIPAFDAAIERGAIARIQGTYFRR